VAAEARQDEGDLGVAPEFLEELQEPAGGRALGLRIGGVLVLGIDEQPVVQAPLNGLEPAFYERFRTTRTRDDTLEFLRKSGIVALDDQGIAHPSVAGILVACGEPREWMPNAFIRAVAYRGTSPAATDADG